ncbi:hypothetical protein KQX54_011001 [Cotesia glomerata]|uniref:Uncharacterized protein n=1 Tax=Cotesia glomerata TaxID=32391 RepID=A0AAV7IRW4_COTGL|nr:hypothetical protein KQX54_011001 [Cotesia glomerata]
MTLIKFSECCAVKTDLPVEEVLEKNEDSPWLALIGDKTFKRTETVHGVLNADFQVSLNPDRFGMAKTEKAKMKDDVDCFLEWCPPTDYSMLKINFMGSPIVCKLRNADDQVLVGFSTYTYGVVYNTDGTKNVSLVSGTLVEFPSNLNNFFDKLINKKAELQ